MTVKEATVWAARLGLREEGVRGKLTLNDSGLLFTADHGDLGIRVDRAALRKVRRVMGSPVIVVEFQEGDVTRAVALYFAQPPPLPGTGFISKRRGRFGAIQWLGQESRAKREEVKRWVEAIRALTSG
jgi:hypothetical protein